MGSVSVAEMRAAEAVALAEGWSEEQLLVTAGERLGLAIGRYFTRPGTVIGYLGKGHNAGDTLVAMRVLHDKFGWKSSARCAFPIHSFAPLTLKKWDELGLIQPLDHIPDWRDFDGPLLLLDGLVGIGAVPPLRPPLTQLVEEMQLLRETAGAHIAAIDIPSGIHPDTGDIFPCTVTADVTFMIGNAKSGVLRGRAADAAGALAIVPVASLTASHASPLDAICPQTLQFAKSPRPFNFHKGQAGRVAIVAGSDHYTGAAVLAATGALRGGAGLITLHVPAHVATHIASRCPAEIIVHGFLNPAEIVTGRYDALVTGCGLGTLNDELATGLIQLIENSPVPVVIDADALNLIARLNKLSILTKFHILTPHPGEFQRLAPDLADLPREEAAREFADRFPATLLLKGSRTIIAQRGEPLWCNTTGTPGMATGGQGDVLAGVIGARLALGDSPLEAATLSAWLCGRASEIALQSPHLSEESLTPTDTLNHLGAAYQDWRTSTR